MSTLYYGGAIHTLRTPEECFEAMGVENGRVVWLGHTAAGRWEKRVDLAGMHVYPALTDSHLHLLYTLVLAANSFMICQVGPGGVEPGDLAGAERRMRLYCSQNPRQKIVVANGYIPSAIAEKRLPTRRELDEWTGGKSCVVYSIDGHSSAMSTAMLRALGLAAEGHSGQFWGEEHEFMQGRVTGLIARSVTPAMLAKGIANFTNECARCGIVRVCALDGNGDVERDVTTRLLAFLAARMDVDVRLFPQYMDLERARHYFKKQAAPRMGGCGEWELDGAVGAHTAAFGAPYADNGALGHCYYSDEAVRAKVRQAAQQGVQLTCHAIGEDAIRQIVEAWAAVLPEGARRPGAPMMRVDHFEFPRREAVEQVKRLPLAITVQPGFSWLDKRYLKSYEQYLLPEKIAQQVPLRELYEAGVCLCGSSDSPVQSIDPFAQMLGMTEFYLPDQALTPYQALRTYTVNPAQMLGEETEWGTLEEGKRADFMVLKKDFLAAEGAEAGAFCAEYTVKDGRRLTPKRGTAAELAGLCLKRPKKL